MDPNMNKTKRAIWMAILNTGGGVYWPMDEGLVTSNEQKWKRLLCLIQGPCIHTEREWSSDQMMHRERMI